MIQTVQIKDHKQLQRDIKSKAILSTNSEELNRYEYQKNILQHNRSNIIEIETLKQNLAMMVQQNTQLANTVGDLKQKLQEILTHYDSTSS